MAYVEVHQAVRDHRKVLDLAVRLDMSEPCVVGHLVFLWLWSVDNSSDGLLPSSVRLVERACGWTGEPGRFVAALVECGLLDQSEQDGSLWIHDWYEYMGRLVERRRSDAERKRQARTSSAGQWQRPPDIQRTSRGHPGDVQRNVAYPTEDNRTPSVDGEVTENSEDEIFVGAAAPPPDSASATGDAGRTCASPAMTLLPAVSDDSPARKPAPLGRSLKPVFAEDAPPIELAQYLAAGIRSHKPDAKIPRDLQGWAREFDLMLRVDKRPRDAITAVIDFATSNTFWRRVVFSADKLRQKFDTLDCQRLEGGDNGRVSGQANSNRRNSAGGGRSSTEPKKFTDEWYDWRERQRSGLGSSQVAHAATS